MTSAEAGRFASLSEEDFEFNLVDQFFKLVRIVGKRMLFELNYFPREIVIETISLGIIIMISHQNYLNKIVNCIFMCKIVIKSPKQSLGDLLFLLRFSFSFSSFSCLSADHELANFDDIGQC
jgi:hypothetical protein